MKDIPRLKEDFDLEFYLEEHNIHFLEQRKGSEWIDIEECPYCKESYSLSISKNHKGFYCHECREKGDILKFIQSTEGLDFRESLELLETYANVYHVKKKKKKRKRIKK